MADGLPDSPFAVGGQATSSNRLRNCKDCGGAVSKTATSCPNCGAKITTPGQVIFSIGCAVILMILLGIVGIFLL